MNPPYFVLKRKIYEQTDSEHVYRLVEKHGRSACENNMHIDSLRRAEAKETKTFGEARLEAQL